MYPGIGHWCLSHGRREEQPGLGGCWFGRYLGHGARRRIYRLSMPLVASPGIGGFEHR